MFYLLFLVIIPSSCLLGYYFWSRRNLYMAAYNIKGSTGLPIIGSALTLIGKSEDIFEKLTMILAQVENEPVKFWFGPMLFIGLKNPVYLEKIMSSSKFAYKHEIYKFLEKLMGDGLITASGLKPKYKIHRRTIQPLFDLKFVEKSLGSIQRHMEVCLQELDKRAGGDTFNIEHEFHKCSLDFNSEIILGQEMKHLDRATKEFCQGLTDMYDMGFTRMVKIWLHPDFLYNLLSRGRELEEMKRNLNAFIEEALIDSWKRRKLSCGTVEKFVPIIDRLAEIVETNPGLIDKQDLVNHLLTLYAASEDPFALISSFAAVCFGMYPEYQDKAVEEIKRVIGTTPREITLEDIYKLEYMDMCVKEVMRLFPIAPFILRRITEDYQLDKWVLPKGSAIVVPIFSLHRDPEQWENPDHFYPDNFLPEAVKKRHTYSYMPFSAGPRGCIGKTIATVHLKLFLAHFLQRYQVQADGKVPDIELRSDISVRPKKGHNCRIKRRILE